MGEVPRQSLTIGINANKTFSTINPITSNLDSVNDERVVIANEFKNAKDTLKATGQLPISIDNQCLMSMQDGRDASIVLKLFKTACLAYAPTDVSYREHKMSRAQLLQMRKELVDKVTDFMRESGLHKDGAIYPRRYFDDLIMEHQLAA